MHAWCEKCAIRNYSIFISYPSIFAQIKQVRPQVFRQTGGGKIFLRGKSPPPRTITDQSLRLPVLSSRPYIIHMIHEDWNQINDRPNCSEGRQNVHVLHPVGTSERQRQYIIIILCTVYWPDWVWSLSSASVVTIHCSVYTLNGLQTT